jgi:small subunit ribosomal protein S7
VPRKGGVPQRSVAPDPVYQSEMVTRLTNKLMYDGKKSLAQRILYSALQRAEELADRPALEIFEAAVKNAMPMVEVKPRRVGGSTYQVPVEVRPERRTSLALRWLISYSRNRSERSMVERLARELVEASQGAGGAVKRKEEVHRMAEANRPFAHYRW